MVVSEPPVEICISSKAPKSKYEGVPPIADMSAIGGTPSYFDFGAFEEMQISTGGSDTTIATGGVVLNLVTKRGTNEYRGSARYLQAPGSTESSTSFQKSDLAINPVPHTPH